MRRLLLALEEGNLAADGETVPVLRQAMQAIRQYLDELMAGEPNQPLRLLPAHLALAGLRGYGDVRSRVTCFSPICRCARPNVRKP